jgi:hypothetical protein
MEYHGFEYTVLQGIERGVWKWSASIEGVTVMGQVGTRSAAVTAAQKAIDRAALVKSLWRSAPTNLELS